MWMRSTASDTHGHALDPKNLHSDLVVVFMAHQRVDQVYATCQPRNPATCRAVGRAFGHDGEGRSRACALQHLARRLRTKCDDKRGSRRRLLGAAAEKARATLHRIRKRLICIVFESV